MHDAEAGRVRGGKEWFLFGSRGRFRGKFPQDAGCKRTIFEFNFNLKTASKSDATLYKMNDTVNPEIRRIFKSYGLFAKSSGQNPPNTLSFYYLSIILYAMHKEMHYAPHIPGKGFGFIFVNCFHRGMRHIPPIDSGPAGGGGRQHNHQSA
jgi:hypothetical protein